ncbi:MAG: glycosyltransferase family 2 protein [Planctomycetaceae bacterium]|nr:glycosyltransferase family 2 protein [Planctomycetaceae bacterium]
MKTFRISPIEVSTVTPMRNERPCVAEFVRRVDAVLRSMGVEYEIVVVNDGSTDGTGELLDELAVTYPRLRPVHLNRSFGQATATDAGFQESTGQYVVMLDGDLEQPPEEIPRLVEEARKGFDLVSGRRMKRDIHKFLRAIPSRAANWLLRRSTGCQVRDMGGIKCLRGELARSLHLRPGQHRFLPALVHVHGGLVTEIPVTTSPRFAGQSHYGISRIVDVLLDVIYFWFQNSGKGRPIYLFGRIALLLMATTSGLMLGTLAAFASGATSVAWPLLMLSVVSGCSTLAAVVCGVGLELLSEAHASLVDRSHWRISATDSIENAQSSANEHRRAA